MVTVANAPRAWDVASCVARKVRAALAPHRTLPVPYASVARSVRVQAHSPRPQLHAGTTDPWKLPNPGCTLHKFGAAFVAGGRASLAS